MFNTFANAINIKLNEMSKYGELFVVNIDKQQLWDTYLNSFPEGTNPIYKTRTEHDCVCCRHFIQRCGDIVAINDNKLVSIWDIPILNNFYDIVAKSMSDIIKTCQIKTRFIVKELHYGAKTTNQLLNDHIHTWSHFWYTFNKSNAIYNDDYNSVLSEINSSVGVLERGLISLSQESLQVVLDLINDNSLYRGNEFKSAIESFLVIKNKYSELNTDAERNIFLWKNSNSPYCKFKNTVIGTLVSDLSEGVDINNAVAMYESKVAPSNYKRSSAPITKSMVTNATNTINELGISKSLERRYATIRDISVNNVLFVDRNVSPLMKDSITNILMNNIKPKKINYDNIEEINIDNFITNVLPNATSLELLFTNCHKSNLISLIAPEYSDSKNIFKWNNNFSWSYNGNVTDSIKDNVKKYGGNTNGVLRFSIQWNENGDNNNDFDAHCITPSGFDICFRNKVYPELKGSLDVDIITPQNKVAVENIIFTDENKLIDGDYKFIIDNYTDRGGIGVSAEIEYNGKILSFKHNKKIKSSENLHIATIHYSKINGFSIKESLDFDSQNVWGLLTDTFHRVNTMLLSPNYWDGQTIGNKHYVFIINNCLNPNDCNGFYNEFLNNELTPHRKVFEVLSNTMKCKHTNEQLSGLGFSTTIKNEIICKVNGSFCRQLKIKF